MRNVHTNACHTNAMCEILTFRNLSPTNPINRVVNLPSFLMQSSKL